MFVREYLVALSRMGTWQRLKGLDRLQGRNAMPRAMNPFLQAVECSSKEIDDLLPNLTLSDPGFSHVATE
jgi:hypothetical protein